MKYAVVLLALSVMAVSTTRNDVLARRQGVVWQPATGGNTVFASKELCEKVTGSYCKVSDSTSQSVYEDGDISAGN